MTWEKAGVWLEGSHHNLDLAGDHCTKGYSIVRLKVVSGCVLIRSGEKL